MRLNYPVIAKVVALLTLIEGLFMIPCIATALYFDERGTVASLSTTCFFCVLLGFTVMKGLKFKKIHLRLHEGFLIACLSWIYCSFIGALPFYFSGSGFPFIGCYFESVAGFTTTGCTVLDPNLIPLSLQLWRAVCHWLGGIGILVLIVSLFPLLGIGGRSIATAEAPFFTSEKIGARIAETGKYLYFIYVLFTIVEFILLLIGPMDWFDALSATLSSISTGGLIITDRNAAMFESTYVRFIILIFTFLSSLNFLIYYMVVKKKWKEALSNLELRAFAIIISIATLLIAIALKLSGTYTSLWQALKDGLCQVVSILSTSGYYVCDYSQWPEFTQILLFCLMFIGGCSASTSGSLKVFRVIVLLKLVKRGIFKRIHPNSVKPIILNGKPLPAPVVSSVTMHILLFFGVLIVATILLSLNNLDMETTITAAVGIFSNTGMAFGDVGTSGYFGMFNGFSQFIFTILMIAGRLEMYAIILLFSRSFWQLDKVRGL